MPDIQLIDPTTYPGWDALLKTNPAGSFFHTAGWAGVLSASYGFKPLYFTRVEDNQLTGLIAVMEVNSMLTGRRGVLLPFTDQCDPIAANPDTFNALLDTVLAHGRQAGWKTLELRGGSAYLSDQTPSAAFLVHYLDLKKTEKDLLSSFRNSTRRNIRTASKKNIVVQAFDSNESGTEFYRLNCLTRKDHGLPPQPKRFFENLQAQIFSKAKGRIFLAKAEGKAVAGAVYFHFGGKAVFKYGASDKTHHHLRANNLVMWKAIQHYAAAGAAELSFGRTETAHEGLLQFKRGWGTSEHTLHYYLYDFRKDAFIQDPGRVKSSYAVFSKMPLPLLKLVGRVLYRHMG